MQSFYFLRSWSTCLAMASCSSRDGSSDHVSHFSGELNQGRIVDCKRSTDSFVFSSVADRSCSSFHFHDLARAFFLIEVLHTFYLWWWILSVHLLWICQSWIISWIGFWFKDSPTLHIFALSSFTCLDTNFLKRGEKMKGILDKFSYLDWEI